MATLCNLILALISCPTLNLATIAAWASARRQAVILVLPCPKDAGKECATYDPCEEDAHVKEWEQDYLAAQWAAQSQDDLRAMRRAAAMRSLLAYEAQEKTAYGNRDTSRTWKRHRRNQYKG